MSEQINASPSADPDVGQILRRARLHQGLTLRQVEGRTGIQNAHLSQIETGTIKQPGADQVWVLCDLYGLNKRDLMEWTGHLCSPLIQAALDQQKEASVTVQATCFGTPEKWGPWEPHPLGSKASPYEKGQKPCERCVNHVKSLSRP
jgi:transcriptional regulator with XRE-family HTH domain